MEYAGKSPLRVAFYTANYHVSGDVEVNRWRLADVLNDRTRPYVLLEHVVREPLPKLAENAGADLARASQFLQLAKSSVIFAVPQESQEHEVARQQYLSALYAERANLEATLIAPPFELLGTMHLRRTVGLRQAHEALPSEFLPVTHVEAVYLLDRRLRVVADLAVVNRPLGELFTLSDEGAGARRPSF
jgi:hypothetical protein